MHNYHDTHGKLPPTVVYGSDGQPLLSWRVLILPFMEQEELYKTFHLDEPWDSPHNIQLLARMPSTYAPPYGKRKLVPDYHTVCRVFMGKATAFEDPQGGNLRDFPDGTSNTLLIVEAGEPVPWSMPEGIKYAPDQPLPELRMLFKDGFRAVNADASRRFISRRISEPTLRALITRNGGEAIPHDEF